MASDRLLRRVITIIYSHYTTLRIRQIFSLLFSWYCHYWCQLRWCHDASAATLIFDTIDSHASFQLSTLRHWRLAELRWYAVAFAATPIFTFSLFITAFAFIASFDFISAIRFFLSYRYDTCHCHYYQLHISPCWLHDVFAITPHTLLLLILAIDWYFTARHDSHWYWYATLRWWYYASYSWYYWPLAFISIATAPHWWGPQPTFRYDDIIITDISAIIIFSWDYYSHYFHCITPLFISHYITPLLFYYEDYIDWYDADIERCHFRPCCHTLIIFATLLKIFH